MWFQRVMFNLKTRLLNRQDKTPTEHQWAPTSLDNLDDQRAQVIQNRLQDLDRRVAELQSR